MLDLRENIGWLVILVAVIVFAIASWHFSSQIFLSAISVLVGFLASYLLLIKQQKRTWQREYSVKIAKDVYGALFKPIKRVILSLENKELRHVSFGEWETMKDDDRYFMVGEEFREELDDFLEETIKFSDAISNLENTVLPGILKETAKEVFEVVAYSIPNLDVTFTKNQENHVNRMRTLDDLRKNLPLEEIKNAAVRYEDKTTISNIGMEISYQKTDLRLQPFFHSTEMGKIDDFWDLCRKKMSENETYEYATDKNDILLGEAKKIKQKLSRLIAEPWRI